MMRDEDLSERAKRILGDLGDGSPIGDMTADMREKQLDTSIPNRTARILGRIGDGSPDGDLTDNPDAALVAALDEVERLQTAAEAERAAVVAWLRVPCGAHYFADAIERGEHRADCYQREEGRPWVPAHAPVQAAPVAESVSASVSEPVCAVEPQAPRRRVRNRQVAGPRVTLPPLDTEMRAGRFALLEQLATGQASVPADLPTGKALATQLGCLRVLGWLDDADCITEKGRAVYRAQVELRAEWARRRGAAVPRGRPKGSARGKPWAAPGTSGRVKRPRFGVLRWALLSAAATGMRGQWLAVAGSQAAATQIGQMVIRGWVTREGGITDAGREVYLDELDLRARRANSRNRGGGR